MISFDSNLLLYSFSAASPFHAKARAFLRSCATRDDVAVSEFVLVEFYTLLRNPAVLTNPLTAHDAVHVVQAYRRHPRWALFGFDPQSAACHEELWRTAGARSFARRRIYDTRLALCLRRQGVTEFATANEVDFQGCGFKRVWNPIEV